MTQFDTLSKGQRELCIRAGLIRRAAKKSGLTRATISRTFSGDVKQPNGKAVRILTQVIGEILREEARNLAAFNDLGKVLRSSTKKVDKEPPPPTEAEAVA